MIHMLLVFAPVLAFVVLVAATQYLLRSGARDGKRWTLVLRGVLPLVALVLINAILFAIERLVGPRVEDSRQYELSCLLGGFAAYFLFVIDVIRCKGWVMKGLGILYVVLGFCLTVVLLAQ